MSDPRWPYGEAARRATDDHPLPGEDTTSPYVDDAQHWVNVYTELLEFKERMLVTLFDSLQHMPQEAVDEVRTTDAVVLDAEATRFKRRLRLWQERLEELSGG